MNTQTQNAALNEQPPNKNRQSAKHKHDHEQTTSTSDNNSEAVKHSADSNAKTTPGRSSKRA